MSLPHSKTSTCLVILPLSVRRLLLIGFLMLIASGGLATIAGLASNKVAHSNAQVQQPAAAREGAMMPLPAAVAAATITVNSTDDVLPVDGSDGKCTLREAINAANTNTALSGVSGECVAGSGDDTINFDPTVFVALGPQTINLKGALPFINNNLIINGPGAKLLTIRRDTGGDYNIFNVGQIVTISGLTITNGLSAGGGGINNGGTLTVNDCAISGNTVSGGTGERNGGGIYNTGTLTINNSTISGNNANAPSPFFSYGGGIYNTGTLTINNSTISGNNAKENGGGVMVFGGQATLTNVTISNNHSNTDDNGGNQGGGLMRFFGTILLNNTIIAGNFQGSGTTTPQDLGGFSFAPASSNNIIGADSGNSGLTNGVNGNKIGSSATPVDARLAALADNGGPTRTHALLPSSPAIDAGNDTIAANAGLTLDQRGTGFLRIVDGDGNATANVDVGAFEIQGLVVNTTDDASDTDTSDGICDSNAAAGEQCTLRAAIEQANARPGTDAINFSLSGVGPHITTVGIALPNLSSNIRINGLGADVLTVQRSTAGGTPDFRIFWVSNGQEASISGLTMANGKAIGGSGLDPTSKGGAIYNDHGTLRINNCTLSGNSASIYGGAIFNDGENNNKSTTLTVTNSTISGNQAGQGGAIYNDGIFGNAVLILSNSTISGNDAGGNGGAIYNDANGSATLIATNCTITNNRADTNINDSSTSSGGGLYLASIFSSKVTLRNTIVAGNFVGSSPATTADDVRGILDVANSSFNLIGTCPSCGISNGTNNNQVGVTNARLGSLADNGGPTQTHALLPGSPALDAGSNALIPQDTFDSDGDNDSTEPSPFDQRGLGYPRIADAADADIIQTVDIGAFEAHPSIEDITDKTINEDGGLSYSFNYGDRSLGIKSVTFSSSNTALITNHNILCHPFASTCSDLITPASDQFGSATITITLIANNDAVISDSFNLTVTPVNDAPTTSNDALSGIAEDSGPRNIPFSTLTANDSKGPANENGQSLIVKTVNSPVGGTVSIVGTDVVFTPAANYYGPAAFVYTVEDNGTPPLTSNVTGIVSFNITPVADTPSVTNASTNEDTQTTTGLVITHPDDAAVSNFRITSITGGTLFQNNGTTVINNGDFITAVQGAAGLKFTPAENSNVNGSFQVQSSLNATPAGLGGDFVTATITVNPVNDAPTLDAFGNLAINEDAPLQTVNLSGIGAGGGETQTLTVTATSDNTGLIPNPTVNYTSPNATGTISFTPVANQSGGAIISVTATDNGGTANGGINTVTRTFTVTVNAVNDAPVNTVPGAQTVQYPSTLSFAASNGNAISVADVDAGAGLLRVTLSATGGNLTLSTTSGLVFFIGDGRDDSDMSFAGTSSDINAALNSLAYKPTLGFNGSATLTVATNDQGNTGAGGALTDTDIINITVVATTLQFNALSYTIAEDGGSLSIIVNRAGDPALPVTVNYTTSDAANPLQNCNVMNGAATSRCDYVGILGTLHFAALETSKTLSIPIVDDTYLEGPENFAISLSNPSAGTILGANRSATIQIADNSNDGAGQPNPIDDKTFFVRQHYIDFLSREPDPLSAGWVTQLDGCAAGNQSCRLSVSQGIYASQEFRDRGYFIYKFYSVSLGRKPSYEEFNVDRARVSGFQSEAELEQSKVDFIADFMGRGEFANNYNGLSNDAYVQKLFTTAGVAQVSVPGGAAFNVQGMQQRLASEKNRAQILREIAESPEVSAKFQTESTIVMHYFGYLRRDPDASYQDWITILTTTGDSLNVTNGFINSAEYRARFGQ